MAFFHSKTQAMVDMFRILSLDGGGIKGVFVASVLAALEEATKLSVVDHFDLVTGTSTGGIIAIGLGLGIPPKAILDFYRRRGGVVFPSTGRIDRGRALARWFTRPKYSREVLRAELNTVFRNRKFGESQCRLVIPTYDAIGGRIFLFKTAHDPRFKFDHNSLATDVALATSAAPSYFSSSPFSAHLGARYVDGGVWANSPILVGLVEAVSILKKHLDEIDILSIGCTTTPFSIAERANAGLIQWNTAVLRLMMEGQMEAARAQASLLLGGRVHRINAVVSDGTFALDDARSEKIVRLMVLGRAEAVKREHLEVVTERFVNGSPAARFSPFHQVVP
jgi:uncharacterized protein